MLTIRKAMLFFACSRVLNSTDKRRKIGTKSDRLYKQVKSSCRFSRKLIFANQKCIIVVVNESENCKLK